MAKILLTQSPMKEKTFILAFVVLVLVLVGVWTVNYQRTQSELVEMLSNQASRPVEVLPPTQVPSPAPESASETALPANPPSNAQNSEIAPEDPAIEAARQRLEQLNASLTRVTDRQVNAENIQSEIEDVTARMSSAQAFLENSRRDLGSIQQSLVTYQRQTQIQRNNAILGLQSQLQTVDASIVEAENRLRELTQNPSATNVINSENPLSRAEQMRSLDNQLVDLRRQRTNIQNEIQVVDLSTQNASLETEQTAQNLTSQNRENSQAVQQQITDLQAELNYWRGQQLAIQRQDGSEVQRQTRISVLQEQIQQQEQQIDVMESASE